jgi:large subunit ribosomal protein L6
MSRVGKQPIPIPEGVKVEIRPDQVTIRGPLATISYPMPRGVAVEQDEGGKRLTVSRTSETKQVRALHGTCRSRLAGIVEGVSKGFKKRLEIGGVGYQARLQGEKLVLQVGFSHPVEMDVPEGLKVEVPAQNVIRVVGSDKQKVGQFAAEIRSVRPPEPYNAKGIRYAGEHIRRKQGKTFAGGE